MALQPTFGRPMREHFLFDKDYVPLNHGSFGAHPTVVRDAYVSYADEEERNTDLWLRKKFYALLNASREAVATLIHADPSSIVFLPNATTAINVVLRSLEWGKGDVILTYDTIYSGVDKTVAYIVESTAAQTEVLDVRWPISDDDLVAGFEANIKSINASGDRRVRMAILDTVTSNPGLRIPFERLIQICREQGVLSLVDGAHGIGQIPIDLKVLDADFFTSNLHKWLYVPRGCAILHVPKRNQHLIRSSIPTSHGFLPKGRDMYCPLSSAAKTAFQRLFEFTGTMNANNWLTVPAALEFRNKVCGGEDAIMRYCVELARKGGDKAAEILGTDVLDNEEGTLRSCAFANVRLPLTLTKGGGATHLSQLAGSLTEESLSRGTCLFVGPYHGVLRWRISAQCYLDMKDIELGASILKELCEEAQTQLNV